MKWSGFFLIHAMVGECLLESDLDFDCFLPRLTEELTGKLPHFSESYHMIPPTCKDCERNGT